MENIPTSPPEAPTVPRKFPGVIVGLTWTLIVVAGIVIGILVAMVAEDLNGWVYIALAPALLIAILLAWGSLLLSLILSIILLFKRQRWTTIHALAAIAVNAGLAALLSEVLS